VVSQKRPYRAVKMYTKDDGTIVSEWPVSYKTEASMKRAIERWDGAKVEQWTMRVIRVWPTLTSD
jgi:hypothetical protein